MLRSAEGLAGVRLRSALCLMAIASGAQGQVMLTPSGPAGRVRIFNTDLAVLSLQEPRRDLPCTVIPVKPSLGFDLRFHTGYEVSIPLKELAGSENLLTMIFRVTPLDAPGEPVYFLQRVRVPAIEADARGDAYLQGGFDVGEGRYHVDWLMRDRSERFCSHYWDVEAQLAPRDRDLTVALPPGRIEAADAEPFREEPPVARALDQPPLNVKVLVNFAPQNARAATLQPLDIAALVAILRGIARDPRISKFSVIAFNLQEQRIIYRQDGADRIDFPTLGEALQSLNLGTIDLKRLAQKHGETQFLTELIQREIGGEDRPDALIFAGPKVMLEENVPVEALKEVGEVEYPVFYMNYILNPQTHPWRDAIGRAVRFFRGYEYTITRPRDLWIALSDIVARALHFKTARKSTGSGSQ